MGASCGDHLAHAEEFWIEIKAHRNEPGWLDVALGWIGSFAGFQ